MIFAERGIKKHLLSQALAIWTFCGRDYTGYTGVKKFSCQVIKTSLEFKSLYIV